MNAPIRDALVPDMLAPKTRRIFLEGLDIPVDIGFHDFEIGTPQRLLVTVEVRLDADWFPTSDAVDDAWNYDVLRSEILRLATGRRYNLQESLVHAIYAFIASRPGVTGLRVRTCKPDVYPDCAGVGVELSSF